MWKHAQQYFFTSLAILVIGVFTVPFPLLAATSQKEFEVAAWIPYWNALTGSAVADKNLATLTSVYPFGYTVNYDGTLEDTAKLATSDTWKNLKKNSNSRDVDFIPTVTWSDGININRILSDKNLRAKHIDAIANMVNGGGFDGVDIDYEGKLAITKDYFSTFLKELNSKLGGKELVCSIEARTPPESLYRVVPTIIEYANDYTAIGTSCDRVVLLAYDQGRADFVLNGAKAGAPYIPIADTDWVRKVVTLASKSIPKEKILLGVPTYGFNYEVTVSPNWFQSYKKLWSISAPYATQTAPLLGGTPVRNKAGEMTYSYAGATTPKAVATYSVPAGTTGDMYAQRALSYANATGQTVTINTFWWSDAEAIKQKVSLAKELGLAGISIFRVDGNEDPAIWPMLAKEK